MKIPLAAAGLDRQPSAVFHTAPEAHTQKHFYSVPKGKAGLAEVQLCLPPPALCRAQCLLLPASPLSLLRTRSSHLEQSGELHQATPPVPWDRTCHECRLSQGPEHPNNEKGFIRSISKPVLSQLQHLNPEMSTCRAFTRSSNYADADLQE